MFIDNKYFDIPSTMEAAVRASFEVGASFCTVHAQAGPEALTMLAALEESLCQTRPFRILAVTQNYLNLLIETIISSYLLIIRIITLILLLLTQPMKCLFRPCRPVVPGMTPAYESA